MRRRPPGSLRLDRLGRSLSDLIGFSKTLERRGVGLKSLKEQIDTTSSGGRLVFHMFGALAEFERDLIRERTQAGLAAARARGRLGGRPKKLADAKQLELARALYDGGQTNIATICATLGISRATLYRYLKDRDGDPAARMGFPPLHGVTGNTFAVPAPVGTRTGVISVHRGAPENVLRGPSSGVRHLVH